MLAIVRIALSRPYTFVVMAMLIVIFGVTAAIKTPTDIFPNIGIPVVAVVWTYNGLPPDDMSGRVIYYYERTLSAQVNDIEHIESQSLAGYGVVKVFFQPNVNINSALAQITAASQTVLKLLPPGITPPYVLELQCFERADPPAGVVQRHPVASGDIRRRTEFHPPTAGDSRRRRGPLALWRQGAAGPGRSQPGQVAGLRTIVPGRGRSDCAAERHHPGWNRENRSVRICRLAQRRSQSDLRIERLAHSRRRRRANLHPRCRLRSRGQPAANQHGAGQRLERRLDDHPENGIRFDARRHRRRQGPAAETASDAAVEP